MRRFKDSSVARVFAAYPEPMRVKLMALRELILGTATQRAGVGPVEETLKWGQPSYLTPNTHSGSTIRIGPLASQAGEYAIFFHCQTSLVDTFKKRFGSTFRYAGNRALVFSASDRLPKSELSECIAMALTYHLKKKQVPDRPAHPMKKAEPSDAVNSPSARG
jgi:hypothetical protein